MTRRVRALGLQPGYSAGRFGRRQEPRSGGWPPGAPTPSCPAAASTAKSTTWGPAWSSARRLGEATSAVFSG